MLPHERNPHDRAPRTPSLSSRPASHSGARLRSSADYRLYRGRAGTARLRGESIRVRVASVRFLRRWRGCLACHGDSCRYGCVAYCGDDGRRFCLDVIPARCTPAATTGTWLWPSRRQLLSTVRFASSRALLSATCSLCSSRPRKRPVVPRRCAKAACSSAVGSTASLAFMCGPIFLPARWRAVPVRCWRARARRTFISTAASIHIAKTYGVPVEESHDAALAAAKFLVAERELMDELGADEPCIGKFGLLQAGTVCNAVAGEAHVAGSLRVFTDAMFDRAREGVRRALDEACTATGCTYDLDFAEGLSASR